jgi:hypothetical protein
VAGPKEQLSPGRLCDAAEAALRAAAEVGQRRGGEWPYPVTLLGTGDEPEYLAEFAPWEVRQASEFLVRLGMISLPQRKGRLW